MPNEMTPLEAAEKLEEMAEISKNRSALVLGVHDDIVFEIASSYLRKIAAGEYKPVVHAHWIKRDIFGEDPLGCSNCHNSVSVFGYEICPSCGALMDESDMRQTQDGKDDSHETD